MFGWNGKIMKIDLTSQKTTVLTPPIEIYQKFIGGKGLGGYYLKPLITDSWDSPKMPLLFFPGPLVGTISPTSGRMHILSRSPLTCTIGDTSVGGKLGTQIKRAGWDGIIITGQSQTVCGIHISDSTIEFKAVSQLTGLEISTAIQKIAPDGSIAIIGPAAENGVAFSNIVVDGYYFSGRNGLGLVMAQKNLKYLQVRGTGKISISNRDELLLAREQIFRLVAASPILKGELGISNYGTGALYDLINSRRMMPSNNFRSTFFAKANQMNAWNYKQKYQTNSTGCSGCHIQCKQRSKNNQPIPEFETMSHFSALLGNSDLETVLEANRICNEYGMDTISAAATLACYAEIENVKLKTGEILNLLQNIAFSRKIGAQLKLGAREYARSKGKSESAIAVKGLELPAYDPRGAYGMSLAYVTSTRGGCHLRAYPISHEILRKPVATDRFSFSGKARIIKLNEDLNAVIDSLTACKFIFFAATLEEYANAFTGVTGVKTTAQDLLKIGERIYYNERIMNAMNGFTKEQDDLPTRFFDASGSSGDGIEIKALNREEFLGARANYYKIRGLSQNGLPTHKKCNELELTWNN